MSDLIRHILSEHGEDVDGEVWLVTVRGTIKLLSWKWQ